MITKPIFSDDSESLQHYGVKGMKWGKHKWTAATDPYARINIPGQVQAQISQTTRDTVEAHKKHATNTWISGKFSGSKDHAIVNRTISSIRGAKLRNAQAKVKSILKARKTVARIKEFKIQTQSSGGGKF